MQFEACDHVRHHAMADALFTFCRVAVRVLYSLTLATPPRSQHSWEFLKGYFASKSGLSNLVSIKYKQKYHLTNKKYKNNAERIHGGLHVCGCVHKRPASHIIGQYV